MSPTRASLVRAGPRAAAAVPLPPAASPCAAPVARARARVPATAGGGRARMTSSINCFNPIGRGPRRSPAAAHAPPAGGACWGAAPRRGPRVRIHCVRLSTGPRRPHRCRRVWAGVGVASVAPLFPLAPLCAANVAGFVFFFVLSLSLWLSVVRAATDGSVSCARCLLAVLPCSIRLLPLTTRSPCAVARPFVYFFSATAARPPATGLATIHAHS